MPSDMAKHTKSWHFIAIIIISHLDIQRPKGTNRLFDRTPIFGDLCELESATRRQGGLEVALSATSRPAANSPSNIMPSSIQFMSLHRIDSE